MFYKKPGIPDESELVLCTVKKVLFHSVFASLDEYKNLDGMIHISEVSPGRIRNIRDFVKEGKTIVCKVLRVNREKGQIDLSLRRVSSSMKKKKSNEYKQEQRAERILEITGKKMKIDLETMYKNIGYEIIENFGSLYDGFMLALKDEEKIKKLKVDEKYLNLLIETIKENIKPPEVTKSAILALKTLLPDGIDIIKLSLKEALGLAKQKKYNVKISYISAPKYKIDVKAEEYKKADNIIKEISDAAIKLIEKNKGQGQLIE
ncbi:translation initiation factor IF-2 subunit alpha [Candidatus Woesearchaeota archaeon]|nr:translation initiation factor IF-2 subunit alpha [Candidatus Woesearchaeota archaeon]